MPCFIVVLLVIFSASFSSERACKSLTSKQSLVIPFPLSHKAFSSLRTRQHPSVQNPTTLFIIVFLLWPVFHLLFPHLPLFFISTLSLSLSLSLSLHLLPLVCPLLDFIIFSGVLIGNLSACRPLFVLEPWAR